MSITSANATIFLAVAGVFPVPVQIQGFAADDVFETEPLASAEVLMGVDGVMSAGFVYVPVKQGYMLQADSLSNDVFDEWWASMQQAKSIFYANAVITLIDLGTKWNLTRGALTGYQPLPNAKKLLQPRKFEITWNSVNSAAVI